MKWEYKNLPERIIEELDIRIHLEADVKAFTYIDAQSFVWRVHRDLIIKENDDELVVKAFAYDPALDGWRYPTMKVGAIGTENRTRAENMLLKDGNFSPLGHLKGVALDPLIKSINWDSDSDKLKCEKIYHFLAFKAPEGYENGDLDWLFDFVKANTDRVVKVIRMWKKEH
ncbi:hypothetical protein FOZ62_016703 [Perkinsus olseni]|nr:hypothetical protein FOZ62_016703 [Perkinsus olseni]